MVKQREVKQRESQEYVAMTLLRGFTGLGSQVGVLGGSPCS
jgi:hypothetical protein